MRILALTLSLLLAAGAVAADRIVVHEWGTFTVLQDEQGRAVTGINSDDEPLPQFVHTLGGHPGRKLIQISNPLTPALGKAPIPETHPDVKLRLETPVTYFYLPKDHTGAVSINVRVRFQGGWLTEFYPRAEVQAPGFDPEQSWTSRLAPDAVGTLNWRALKLGIEGRVPETDSNVWTAPRVTDSVFIESHGEAEKFLFYRGVGNIDAPLRVEYSFVQGTLKVSPGAWPTGGAIDTITIPKLWLVDVKENGTVAFVDLGTLNATPDAPGQFPLNIQFAAHTAQNMSALRASMLAALISDGLYPDEASAMLKTWELSYFKSAGTRLFFIVPREWTDAAIPIDFSVPVNLTRTMMGRIELINPRQRLRLNTIALTKVSDYESLTKQLRGALNPPGQLLSMPQALASNLPRPYDDFLRLGRFRSALLLHEQAARPTPNLSAFIENMKLAGR